MNKNIEIEYLFEVDYHVQLKVVAEYVKQYQISLTNSDGQNEYGLQCFKHGVIIEIDDLFPPLYWVKVHETKRKYKFRIWR